MPRFYTEYDHAYVTVDPSEFMSTCDDADRQEIIDYLFDKGYLKDDVLIDVKNRDQIDSTFRSNLYVLKDKWYMLTQEDEETINKITNKYR